MKHRIGRFKLKRDIDARKALQFGLIKSVLENGSIVTTISKAKFAKPYLEKVITKGKVKDVASRRNLLKVLRSKALVSHLIDNVSPKFESRNGGYSRIQRLSIRSGDNAQMVKLSLVENINKYSTKKTDRVKKESAIVKEAKVIEPVSQKAKKSVKKPLKAVKKESK